MSLNDKKNVLGGLNPPKRLGHAPVSPDITQVEVKQVVLVKLQPHFLIV